MEIYREILKMADRGRAGVLITVIEKKGQGPAVVGKKLLLSDDGMTKGTIGGGELEYEAILKAREVLEQGNHCTQLYDLSGEERAGNHRTLDMLCGGMVTLFFEYIPIAPSVYILGIGHVGKHLLYHMENLDYRVTLMDDRPETVEGVSEECRVIIGDFYEIVRGETIPKETYVVIAGYSHEVDYEILKAVYEAGWRPRYIGLLASSTKSKVIVSKLRDELGSSIDIDRIYSPVGLDIGGRSPEEIAISILSEIQAIRYGKIGNRHLNKLW